MKLFSILSASLPLSILASPVLYSHNELPREAVRLALDDRNGHILAFDIQGRSLGAYPVASRSGPGLRLRSDPIISSTASCVTMQDEDIQSIPGLQRLRDEADKNWGTGKRKEVVNDKDLPDQPATVCADEQGMIIPDGEPECRVLDSEATGNLENGKYTLKDIEKLETTETTETTKTTTWAIGRTVSATFGINDIAGVSISTTFSTEITNTLTKAQSVTHTDQIEQTIEQPVDVGEEDSCHVYYQRRTCTSRGKGYLKMVATGFLWFEYEDRVQGHYKWALKMDDILPNIDDRSQTIELKHAGSTQQTAHFHAEGCTKSATTSRP